MGFGVLKHGLKCLSSVVVGVTLASTKTAMYTPLPLTMPEISKR